MHRFVSYQLIEKDFRDSVSCELLQATAAHIVVTMKGESVVESFSVLASQSIELIHI